MLRGRELLFELVNPSFANFFPGRELLGRTRLDAVPETTPELIEIYHRVFDTGEPYVAQEYLSRLDRDGDGVPEDSWFSFSCQPLRDSGGSVSRVVVVAVDVTMHVRARMELKRANRELEEFAYVASHDIQEPLRTVSIYSQMLANRFGAADEEAQTFSRFIRTGIDRMETLIRGLLTYSRVMMIDESATGTADLNESLEEAMSVLKGKIEESSAVIIAGGLPKVRAETGQLVQVFQNLMSNALKYRSAERDPKISITAEKRGHEWTIAVRDNGIGFRQEYAVQIFGLFKRLHKGEYPGTGLGLAICQRIVERYGGRMWAEGEPGAGATFFFSLPAAET